MNQFFQLLSISVIGAAMLSCSDSDDNTLDTASGGNVSSAAWHLEWSDDFNGPALDETAWSMTDRGTPDWANTQSHDPRCFEFRDGALVLKGIYNNDLLADESLYLTGGIWSKNKQAFGPGSIQVRARLPKGAQGAWPAIWMMPFSGNEGWPECGEIDIMERLNFDNSVYQSLHSNYIDNMGGTDPQRTVQPSLDPSQWHIYEVQIWENSVMFYIDHKLTLSYPKINGGADGQFPYYKQWYLIIDMQLGGSWVGAVESDDLPVEMEVDWVRYYKYY
ncbi:MAG: glycoside hydrolase family 16 protein [Bacteroides sp.]|nr:glycoside hydrolase family 16 protein [Bacteroides sp.]MCM1412932.1 glycoside hydrolase family 16 protein [Bacteroides sp.]MCM1471601.1 glycoside hydrolase family 16 protein [Bacteroides sp.]